MVRAERRDHDGREDQHRGDDPVGGIGIAVAHAERAGEQDAEHDDRHQVSARPAEQQPVGLQAGAFLVIRRDLRDERRAGGLVEGDEGADQNRNEREVNEKARLAPVWWVPEQEIAQRDRQRGGIHEGMAAAPAATEIIRPIADQRVADRVDYQCDQDGEADQPRLEPDDRPVEQQQEVIEAAVLDAERRGARSMRQLEPDRRPRGRAFS